MKTMKNWKIMLLTFSLLIIASFLFPTVASAQSVSVGNTVGQGVVLDQNVILYGMTVTMDGVINGDLVAIGTDVKINGPVNGDLVVAGKNVQINGPVSGNAYISALFLVFGPQATIGMDVYFFGNSISTQSGSTIKRDLNVISLDGALSGNVDRRVNAQIGAYNLFLKVYQFLISKGWLPKSLQVLPQSFQDGNSNHPMAEMAFGLPAVRNLRAIYSPVTGGVALSSISATQVDRPANAIDAARVRAWGISLLRNLVSLLILGLLFTWLVPAQLRMTREQARTKPWRALLTGLLVFILGWLIAILALLLVLALAVFLYWVSLPTLGFFTGAFGFMAIGVALSIFYLSIVYFSKIVIAYLIGWLIFKRFIPAYAQSRVWPLVTGIIIYALLASIPYLGWLIAVIATLLGLGAIWMLTGARQLPEEQAAPQPEIASGGEDMTVSTEG